MDFADLYRADSYRALKEHAALGSIAPRGAIGLAGKDRAGYLQGLLTNDIQALTPGTGCYSAWLSPQGRMLTDLHVLESGDMILLDVPAAAVQDTLQRLDQFLFSEDVQVADLSASLRSVWLHGPRAAALLERVVSGIEGLAAWPEYTNARGEFAAAPVSVARISQLGTPGYCVYVEAAQEHALLRALEGAGASTASREVLEAARVEAGYPIFGMDMTEDTIPLEAGIEERAISFSKGCYVGQEVIIRVLHRGHGRVAKKLVALTIDDGVAVPGALILSGEREIGVVTSAAESPRVGAIALGYVHRDFVAPGTRVDVQIGRRASATVTERPIP